MSQNNTAATQNVTTSIPAPPAEVTFQGQPQQQPAPAPAAPAPQAQAQLSDEMTKAIDARVAHAQRSNFLWTASAIGAGVLAGGLLKDGLEVGGSALIGWFSGTGE